MEETTMTTAFKAATEVLHDHVAALGEATDRKVRKAAPKVRQALSDGYDETAETVRSLAGNRSVQGWVAAGVLGIIVGMFLARRSE